MWGREKEGGREREGEGGRERERERVSSGLTWPPYREGGRDQVPPVPYALKVHSFRAMERYVRLFTSSEATTPISNIREVFQVAAWPDKHR